MNTIEGQTQDQLTAELKHFVACVQNQQTPRVTGEQARDAIVLAERIVHSLQSHSWTQQATELRKVA